MTVFFFFLVAVELSSGFETCDQSNLALLLLIFVLIVYCFLLYKYEDFSLYLTLSFGTKSIYSKAKDA